MSIRAVAVLVLLVLVFGFVASVPAFAKPLEVPQADEGGKQLQQKISEVAGNVIDFVRGIFSVVAFILVVWIGILALGMASNPNNMITIKRLAVGLIICGILVMATDKVVGAVLGLLGK